MKFSVNYKENTQTTRVKITFANYTEVKIQSLGDLRNISIECKILSDFQHLENHTEKQQRNQKSNPPVV